MKDPLVHLVRNCIDHGIETPKQRKERGKPPRATIRIAIVPRSAVKVEIVVSDDGAGIDFQKVRAASVKLGLVSEEDARKTDEQQSVGLIFQSGVSTSPMITEISGRGLGLAIVREKAEKVGGTVSVESHRELERLSGSFCRLLSPDFEASWFVSARACLYFQPARTKSPAGEQRRNQDCGKPRNHRDQRTCSFGRSSK